jgi:phosphomevalonate kinase
LYARAPGKLVALGEYAVLEGAPALVLAVDRFCDAELAPSSAALCRLTLRAPDAETREFAWNAPAGAGLIDLVREQFPPATHAQAWVGTVDSAAFFAGTRKLGLGSSTAALCAWAGVWAAAFRPNDARPALQTLIELHRRFQGGRGSGLDVAASYHGGMIEFRLDGTGVPHIGSVRLPNSVGFAGIFAGRSASTPALLARYRAFCADRPQQAAQLQRRLRSIAEAGCAAARGDDAGAFIEAIREYGRGLGDLGLAIDADIVTAEHHVIGQQAARFGVAYKVSGAGGGDLGIVFSTDAQALEAFKQSMTDNNFRVVDFCLAERGLIVEERSE